MFSIEDAQTWSKDALFSSKQNMNYGGTGCFICLYILSTTFSTKIHQFSVLFNLFLTVPRTVISWEARLASILLEIKGLVKMNRFVCFLLCWLWIYYICIKCLLNAAILICCILYTLYPYLVDYLKWK